MFISIRYNITDKVTTIRVALIMADLVVTKKNNGRVGSNSRSRTGKTIAEDWSNDSSSKRKQQ